jgi:anti-sigma B factor antagonist
MEINTEMREKQAIVSVQGDIDAHTAGTVSEAWQQALAEDRKALIIDLGGVQFMSSAGLRAILATHQKAQESGTNVFLAAPQPGILRVLDMAGFTKILSCYETVEEAVSTAD